MLNCFSALYFDATGTAEALVENLNLAVEKGAKSLFVMACDENPYQPADLQKTLSQIGIPIFGAVFPQLIYNNRNHIRGSIVCGLDAEVITCEVDGLSNEETDFAQQFDEFSTTIPDSASLVVLVDGLSSCISTFLEECYGVLGPSFPYIGGGAGSLSFEQKPCIFTNKGLRQDIAQVIAIDMKLKTSVEHGWAKLAGPFVVTNSTKNIIQALDYKPAFEVYKDIVEKESGKTFDGDNFFEIAKEFPFGLGRADEQVIVRDPLKNIENDLMCVGEVPENNLVFILKGDADSLIAASKEAADNLAGEKNILSPAIFFDCISRVLFLEKRFKEELESIDNALPEGCETVGALTLGEIADSGGMCIDFYNKTAVLGVFT